MGAGVIMVKIPISSAMGGRCLDPPPLCLFAAPSATHTWVYLLPHSPWAGDSGHMVVKQCTPNKTKRGDCRGGVAASCSPPSYSQPRIEKVALCRPPPCPKCGYQTGPMTSRRSALVVPPVARDNPPRPTGIRETGAGNSSRVVTSQGVTYDYVI